MKHVQKAQIIFIERTESDKKNASRCNRNRKSKDAVAGRTQLQMNSLADAEMHTDTDSDIEMHTDSDAEMPQLLMQTQLVEITHPNADADGNSTQMQIEQFHTVTDVENVHNTRRL